MPFRPLVTDTCEKNGRTISTGEISLAEQMPRARHSAECFILERNGIKLLRLKPDNCNYDFIESELIKLLTTSSIDCPECGNEMIEI